MLIDIMDKNIELKKYDYYAAVKADVIDYINENYNVAELKNMSDNEIDDILEQINCYDSDNITGDMSGSYYCNAWKAEKSLFGNTDLIAEAVEYFEYSINKNTNAEILDVIVRDYVLNQIFYDVVAEIKEVE